MSKNSADKTCVLVCEDEMFVAMMLQDRLEATGYRVLMASHVAKALELIDSDSVDVGLLDINMGGEDSFPVAVKLRERGIPFIFSSGYGDEGLPPEWHGEQMLQKPYATKTVAAAIEAKLAA